MLVRTALGEPSVADALTRATASDVISVGKAAAPMLTEFVRSAPGRVRTAIGIGPGRPEMVPLEATWFAAGHPVPDDRSAAAAELLEAAGLR